MQLPVAWWLCFRAYTFADRLMDRPANSPDRLVLLELNIEKETKRAIRSHRLLHWQDRSRALFTNVCLRWFFAMAILASFIVDALETQYLPLGRGDDARGEIFFSLELAFTVLFAFELSWNMFSYWYRNN